jgi:hypothetical protein
MLEQTQTTALPAGAIWAPAQLEEDVFAPDLSLRIGHHILYLMQVRAAELRRRRAASRKSVTYGKRALGGALWGKSALTA